MQVPYSQLLIAICLALALLSSLGAIIVLSANLMKIKRFARHDSLCDKLDYGLLYKDDVIMLKTGSLLAILELFPKDMSVTGDSTIVYLNSQINNFVLNLKINYAISLDVVRHKHGTYIPIFKGDSKVAAFLDHKRATKVFADGYSNRYFLTVTCTDNTKLNKVLSLFLTKESMSTHDLIALDNYVNDFKKELKDISNMLKDFCNDVKVLSINFRDGFISHEGLDYIHFCLTGNNQRLAIDTSRLNFLDAHVSTEDLVTTPKLKIGDKFVQTLAIDGFPQETYACILDKLLLLDYNFRFNTRFIAFNQLYTKMTLEKQRRLWKQKSKTLFEQFFNVSSDRENKYASDNVKELDTLSTEINKNKIKLGSYTANIVLIEENEALIDKAIVEIKATLMRYGFACRKESFNLVESFLGSLPGHLIENVRRPIVSSENLADLLTLSRPYTGERICPNAQGLKSPSPLLQGFCNTKEPFYLNLHEEDLANTFIVGAPGTGKSFLLGHIMLNLLRYENMQIFAFDNGYSFYALNKALNGNHITLSTNEKTFCIFEHLATDEDRLECAQYLLDITKLKGDKNESVYLSELLRCLNYFHLKEREGFDIKDIRKFSFLQTLIQDKGLKIALECFKDSVLDSCYDFNFDSAITTFECSKLLDNNPFKSHIIKHIFKNIKRQVKGNPIAIIIDEASLILHDKVFEDYVEKLIRTVRKDNVFLIFATQSLEDILSSPSGSVFIDCIKTRIYLPNNDAKAESKKHYEALGLEEHEIEIIATAKQKHDYFLTKGNKRALFSLCTSDDERSLLSFASKSKVKEVDRLVKLYGNETFFLEKNKKKAS